MLVFLIPLKARASASDWQRVVRLCERTLRSAAAQTHPDFRIILSCTDAPETGFEHPNLIVLQGDYPKVDPTSQQSQSLDKVLKLSRASSRAREFAPCHVMVLDADDLVSNRLAAHVANEPDKPGWRVDSGWVYREGSRWIWRHNSLSSVCGSTFLIRCTADDLPAEPKEGELLLTAHISHTELDKLLIRKDRAVEGLPFPGTIYCAGHGDNWSRGGMFRPSSGRALLHRWIDTFPVSASLRNEFGLYKV